MSHKCIRNIPKKFIFHTLMLLSSLAHFYKNLINATFWQSHARSFPLVTSRGTLKNMHRWNLDKSSIHSDSTKNFATVCVLSLLDMHDRLFPISTSHVSTNTFPMHYSSLSYRAHVFLAVLIIQLYASIFV